MRYPMARLSRVMLAGTALVSLMVLQGCALAIIWVGAVGFDNVRHSEIEFHPFENSWLAKPESSPEPLTSIAVVPFPGQGPMAERWAALLQEATDLRVVGPAEVARQAGVEAVASFAESQDDYDAAQSARRLSDTLQVNALLFGRVADTGQETSFGGLKHKQDKRLYLYLARADGTLLWKDEMPFTVVEGGKQLDQVDEEWARRTMVSHVLDHVRKIGLARVGLPLKPETSTAS